MAGGVTIEKLAWRDIPLDEIPMPKQPLRLTLGLGSGLCARDGRVFAITDRGPNLFASQAVDDYGLVHLEKLRSVKDAKVLPMPDAGPEIAELSIEGDEVRLKRRIPLRTVTGERLKGVTLPGEEMEAVYDLEGHALQPHPLGADTEAIAVMPDGGFIAAEEYGPSLLKADADGVVSERWVPKGSVREQAHSHLLVSGVLPKRANKRRRNRGLEALCASHDGKHLFAGFQSALRGEDEHSTPIWKLDARTGEFEGEWLYPFDALKTFRRDAARRKLTTDDLKICELAWVAKNTLLVLERISHSSRIYLVGLKDLPEKHLVVSSDEHEEIGPDIEGMALLSPTEILICSDNDFSTEGAETGFWRITLGEPLS